MSTAAKPGLYANIHAKQERIARGSAEKMRTPGSQGAPSNESFAKAAKTTRAAKAAKPAEASKTSKAAKKSPAGPAAARKRPARTAARKTGSRSR